MTLCRLVHSLAVAALVCVTPALAAAGANTWTSNGPAGQWIRALAQSPTALYAGSQVGGVFESTDGGASWSPINTGLTGTSVFALAVDPTTPSILYTGTTDAGAFRSVDGGANWAPINNGLVPASVRALAIDPDVPTTLYAGTNGGGVFKSVDSGGTWIAINTGNTATTVQALTIDPSDANTLYLGSPTDGVFKSANGGVSWTNVAIIPENVFSIAVDPTNADIVYVGAAIDGVFKSVNGGNTWTAVNGGFTPLPPTVRSLAIDPTNPLTIYAGMPFGGVHISLNGGGSWTALNAGLSNTNVSAVLLDAANPLTLYAGTIGGGVFDYLQDACNDGGSPVVCSACETCSPAFGCIGDVLLGCRVSTHLRKAKLTIKDKEPDLRDRLVWTWSRGQETLVEEFGDPVNMTAYDACIFDESAGPPSLALHIDFEPAVICNNKPCWKAVGDRAFKYRNGEGVPNGATKLILKSGIESKAKIILKAHGELLEMPTLPMAMPFRFQLRNDLGECWEAIYTEDGIKKNDETSFVGKDGL